MDKTTNKTKSKNEVKQFVEKYNIKSFYDLLINSIVAFVASSDLAASSRISPATTENPLPAVPARVASTEAFNAKIFVCNAMSSIVSIMWLISLVDAIIWSIA